MDTKHFELLFRPTWFCSAILAHTWDVLNTSERIILMIYLIKNGSIPDNLKTKALKDSNPIIRMLAVKGSHISEEDDPELFTALQNDESPFVRAAMQADDFFDFARLIPLSHIERLGVIALSKHINAGEFAKFIFDGLQNNLISEKEATKLIIEFVRNPNLHKGLEYEAYDGMDWHTKKENFEAIWNLTTCTPPIVHFIIAEEYPLKTSDNDTIPKKILEQMNQDILEILIWRGCEPLLELIEKNPERFDEEIKKEARRSKETYYKYGKKERSELEELFIELNKLRAEMNERLDALTSQST